jgi:hypothetical protein
MIDRKEMNEWEKERQGVDIKCKCKLCRMVGREEGSRKRVYKEKTVLVNGSGFSLFGANN